MAARAPSSRRTAFVLSGDWHLAADLVQQALLGTCLAWPLRDEVAAPAYLHRALVRAWTDHERRACVVLRHLEDLTVEETADLLGCSTGAVKSQTARGLVAPDQLHGCAEARPISRAVHAPAVVGGEDPAPAAGDHLGRVGLDGQAQQSPRRAAHAVRWGAP